MAIILFLTGMNYSCKRGYIIFDRIDIQIEITPVPFKEIANTQQGESSATIRERVIRAREIQEQRFRDHKGIYFNSQMSERMIHQYAEPDDKSLDLLHMAMERLSLSARAYSRIHNSRPRCQRQGTDTPHSRSHQLPQPRPRRLGRERNIKYITLNLADMARLNVFLSGVNYKTC